MASAPACAAYNSEVFVAQDGSILRPALSRDDSWRALRRMRSSPPGAAASDPQRASTFQTALEQAEQYFRAAQADGVGYEVKPVFVFYGLYQGARAIAAACPRLDAAHSRLSGHGMKIENTRDQDIIGQVTIKALERGAPQTIASALGTDFLPAKSSTALAALWPLIPGADALPAAEPLHRRALRFVPESFVRPPSTPPTRLQARLEQITEEYAAQRWDPFKLSELPVALAEDPSRERLADFLAGYPTLQGAQPRTSSPPPDPPVEYRLAGSALETSFLMNVPDPGTDAPAVEQRCATRYRGDWWVLPAVSGMDRPLHPLLVWWTVTLALSSLARYEPEAWARMVDVDQPGSPAAAIEHLLDTALDAIPQMLVDTIAV